MSSLSIWSYKELDGDDGDDGNDEIVTKVLASR
jgi:hypothetical protein